MRNCLGLALGSSMRTMSTNVVSSALPTTSESFAFRSAGAPLTRYWPMAELLTLKESSAGVIKSFPSTPFNCFSPSSVESALRISPAASMMRTSNRLGPDAAGVLSPLAPFLGDFSPFLATFLPFSFFAGVPSPLSSSAAPSAAPFLALAPFFSLLPFFAGVFLPLPPFSERIVSAPFATASSAASAPVAASPAGVPAGSSSSAASAAAAL